MISGHHFTAKDPSAAFRTEFQADCTRPPFETTPLWSSDDSLHVLSVPFTPHSNVHDASKYTRSYTCVCGESDTLRDARTYIELHLLLHGGGHHDDTDGGDQQEVEGIHDAGACGLFDLRAAAAAAGAGRGAAAAGQLHGEKRGTVSRVQSPPHREDIRRRQRHARGYC